MHRVGLMTAPVPKIKLGLARPQGLRLQHLVLARPQGLRLQHRARPQGLRLEDVACPQGLRLQQLACPQGLRLQHKEKENKPALRQSLRLARPQAVSQTRTRL